MRFAVNVSFVYDHRMPSFHTQKNINTVSGVIEQYISEHLRRVCEVILSLKLLA